MTICDTKKRFTPGFPALVLALLLVPSMSARAQHLPPPVPANKENRLPPIPHDKMTEAQKQAAAEYAAVRPDGMAPSTGGVDFPNLFQVYVRVPEVMIPLLRVQENVHVHPRLPQKLIHFIVLITARHWTNAIWAAHDVDAVKEGLAPETVKSLAVGRRPLNMPPDEEILYDFCTELLANKRVSDATYARTTAKFGEEGAVQATIVVAEYAFISIATNMALPESASRGPLAPFPR